MRITNIDTLRNWDGPAEPEPSYDDYTPPWLRDLINHTYINEVILGGKFPVQSDLVKQIRADMEAKYAK